RLAEEVRRVADILFESEHPAHAAERDAESRPLVLAVRQARAIRRIAAEVEADERRDESVRAGWRDVPHENGRGHAQNDESTYGRHARHHRIPSQTSDFELQTCRF